MLSTTSESVIVTFGVLKIQNTVAHMAASAQPISSVDAGNACKRLQKELMGLMMSKDEGISAFPDADNILSWTATIDGADESISDCVFLIRVECLTALACRVLWNRL